MNHCTIHDVDYEESIGNGVFKLSLRCPKCQEELEKQEASKEEEESRNAQIRSYIQMNIEPEFFNATLENYSVETAEQKAAVKAVKQLLSGEIQKLVMLGKNGTGKTHLAVAAVKKLGGAIFSMSEIAIHIRDSYSPSSSQTEGEILENLSRLPLLVIDELGRSKGSDAEKNTLSYIIDKRHQRFLPLILISNKHHSRDCQNGGCSDCFENYIGEDIISRLAQNGLLIRFSGNDWRKSHRRTVPPRVS